MQSHPDHGAAQNKNRESAPYYRALNEERSRSRKESVQKLTISSCAGFRMPLLVGNLLTENDFLASSSSRHTHRLLVSGAGLRLARSRPRAGALIWLILCVLYEGETCKGDWPGAGLSEISERTSEMYRRHLAS